jgi:hypothetical protein
MKKQNCFKDRDLLCGMHIQVLESFLIILLFMPKKLTLRQMYYSAGVVGFGAWLGDALV